MFEVKYPNSYNYDGKTHIIKIEKVEYISGHLLVYGKSYDIPSLIIEIKYSDEKADWIMIPHDMKEIVEIIKDSPGKSINLTDYMKKELDGKRITNQDELDYVFPKKNDIFIDDSKKTVSEFINKKEIQSPADNFNLSLKNVYQKNQGILNEEQLLIETIKYFFLRVPEALPVDAEELLKINKKKAYRLINDFLDNNKNYLNKDYEEIIVKFLEELFNTLIKVHDTLFTEDDLIDLGSLLAKMKVARVNMLSEEEFNMLMVSAYDLIDLLKERINVK